MQKQIFVLALAGLAACTADSPTGADLRATRGVASPNTPVGATFTISVGGSIVYRESGPGNNGKGECRAGGIWYNPTTRKTSEKAHPQCASVTSGEAITVTFQEIATYVLSTNGNVQLNFSVDPVLLTARGLQYKKTGDYTQSFGTLSHTGDSVDAGRAWTINLGQPLLNNTGNLIVRTGTVLEACNADLGCHPGLMTW